MSKQLKILLFLICLITCKSALSQDANSLLLTADSLFAKGMYADAATAYEKLVTNENYIGEFSAARISELHHQAGISYYHTGKFEKAVENFEKVLALNEELNNENNVALTFNNLGMVYHAWKQYEKAIKYYLQSIEILNSLNNKTETVTVLNNIGIIYNEMDNQPKAIEYFNKALEIDRALDIPVNVAKDLNNIGLAYKTDQQYETAIGYFRQGIQIYQTLDANSDYLSLLKNISATYLETGKYDSAMFWTDHYDKIVSQSGNQDKSAQYLILKGDIHYKLKEYTNALDLYKQALEVSLQCNDQHAMLTLFKSLGNVYFALNDYNKALENLSFALEKELMAENHNEIIKLYNKMGDIYMVINNYHEALSYYQKAYDHANKTNHPECIAAVSNNIGKVYTHWGKFDKAIEFYQFALNDALKNNNTNDIAESYNNIGLIYKAWGKYDEAVSYFNKALMINLNNNITDKISLSYSNIGICYQKKGDINKTFEYLTKAISYAQQSGNASLIALCYTNTGFYYKSVSDYTKALEYFIKAMEIDIKTGKEDNIASDYNNIGTVYISNNDYVNAIPYFEKALAIDSKLNKDADIAIDYNNLGASYIGLNQFDKAIDCLIKSINIKEKLRKTASGDIRREYFESQINTYHDLIFSYLSIQDIPNAFKIIELSKAKLLAERVSKNDSSYAITSISDIQLNIDEKTAIIVYATINREDLTMMVITKHNVIVKKNNKKAFIAKVLQHFETDIKSYIYDNLPENVKNSQNLLNTEVIIKKKELESIIQFYRKLLFIHNPDKEIKEKTLILGKLLYDFLIMPVEALLTDKTNIIIEPDGILGFLPFETLVNNQSEYLVEKYDFSYTQSLSILSMIKNRKHPPGRKSLLAVGGAIYNKEFYEYDMMISDILLKNDSLQYNVSKGTQAIILTEEQINYLQKKTYEAIKNNASLTSIYQELGYGSWGNLPGSLAELRVLSKIITDCDTITAAYVNESYIKMLSDSGKLATYKIIHFSTHGIGIPEIPELSAIILNPEDKLPEDGYLRMGEISDLKLNADFVNLSACETGLGKIYSGEGIVGLSQSFIIAGANGISASLWQVNDKSTAQFMIDVFMLVNAENLTFKEAINKTKRNFISGKYNEKWKSPYYWAPFIFYGN